MTDDERAIHTLVDTWMAATKAGDVQTVLSLIADDALFIVPGQEPFGKEAFAAGGMGDVRIDGRADIRELHVLDHWAWLRNYIDVTMTVGGEVQARRGYTLTILRKEPDGRWVLVRDANLVS